MSAIKSLCERIDETFFEVLAESSQAASYLLADLYRFKATARNEDKIHLQTTLRALKKRLQPQHISLVWQAISAMPESDWEALDPGTQKSLVFLKKCMLAQRIYLGALSMTTLLTLGRKPDWYREVLIAIVRKHLLSHKHPDPFIESTFSYSLLRKGGAEQNFLYLSRYVAKCDSLPIEEITILGSYDSKVAELILKDLTNTLGYFEVSANFASEYACLRVVIAKQWQEYVETYPLDEKIDAFLRAELPHLKKRYHEFRKVILDNKMTRHYQITPPCEPQIEPAASPRLHFRHLEPALRFLANGIQRLQQHVGAMIAQKQRMKV